MAPGYPTGHSTAKKNPLTPVVEITCTFIVVGLLRERHILDQLRSRVVLVVPGVGTQQTVDDGRLALDVVPQGGRTQRCQKETAKKDVFTQSRHL